MDSVFTRYGLPVQVKYLAIIESQLKPAIVSPAGAVGAWQLMPITARHFSLKVTAKYDERTHFYKSTVAAAKYLTYLHDMFDDWLLVMAAYNGGPGSVFKAIKKSGSRNFWKLQKYLPAETRAHVKKFIGTHYYYEGKGSIATLTKDEVAAYRETMISFVTKQNNMLEEKSLSKTSVPVTSGDGGGEEDKSSVVNAAIVLKPQEEE
jgi:membrane-bound lytic murein transglycosylase D